MEKLDRLKAKSFIGEVKMKGVKRLIERGLRKTEVTIEDDQDETEKKEEFKDNIKSAFNQMFLKIGSKENLHSTIPSAEGIN